MAQQPYGVPPLGEAGPAPYVVLAAEGGHDRVVVLDGDGTPHRVTTEVFAELLALETLLAGLPDGNPVVLLVPEAGARGLDLPRAVADRTGRTTWATSGRLRFTQQTEGGPAAVSPEHCPGERSFSSDVSSRDGMFCVLFGSRQEIVFSPVRRRAMRSVMAMWTTV